MILNDGIFDKLKKTGFTLKIVQKEQIEDVLQLYEKRIKWFNQKGINQWQQYLIHHNKDEFLKAIENNELFVIYQKNNIVACFELSEDSRLWNEEDNESYYIYKIVSKIGSSGIGAVMFDICSDIAKLNNKKYLKIDCLERNKKLNEIYDSYGFEYVRTDTKDYYTFNLRKKRVD